MSHVYVRQRSQDSDSQCDPHGLEYPGFDVKDQVVVGFVLSQDSAKLSVLDQSYSLLVQPPIFF